MTPVEALVDLLGRQIGLRLDGERSDLAALVDRRVRVLGLRGAGEYVRLLEEGATTDGELTHLAEALSNPHSCFFREEEQLDAVGELLLQRSRERRGPVAAWIAGCAAGEEVYSLAIILRRLGVDGEILGTDVSAEAVDAAREGIYGEWSLRRAPAEVRRLWLREEGDVLRVEEGLRRSVAFEVHNLMARPLPRPRRGRPRWDCILCRNVFIYFTRAAVESVAAAFAEALAPEGTLVLSSTESLQGAATPFSLAPFGTSVGYVLSRRSPPVAASARAETGRSAAPRDGGTDGAGYAAALRLVDAGALDDALRALDAHLGARPDDVTARLTRGSVHLRQRRLDAALADYGRARDASPLLAEAHLLEGLALRKLGDHLAAEQAFRRALFLDPRLWQAALLLAGSCARRRLPGKREAALRAAREALATGPEPAFRSHVAGLKDLDIGRDEAARLLLGRSTSIDEADGT